MAMKRKPSNKTNNPAEPKTIKVAQEVPGSVQGMFVANFLFRPTTTLSLEELTDLLTNMVIVFPPDSFEKLRPSVKRHFIIQSRDGSTERWTGRKNR